MELHKPQIFTDGGPWAKHDHACSICHEKKSVLVLNTGHFQPCWDCQKTGFRTVKIPKLIRRFFKCH
jgi:hypothetical protein